MDEFNLLEGFVPKKYCTWYFDLDFNRRNEIENMRKNPIHMNDLDVYLLIKPDGLYFQTSRETVKARSNILKNIKISTYMHLK